MNKDDKNKDITAGGLFLSVFLKAAVIILGIAVVILAGYFTYQTVRIHMTRDSSALNEEMLIDNQRDPLLLATPAQPVPPKPSKGSGKDGSNPANAYKNDKITVLNGTHTSGVAGAWTDYLSSRGFTDVTPASYYGGVEDTIIITDDEAEGEALRSFFYNATVSSKKVPATATDAVLDDTKVTIIIGENDILN